MKEIVSLFLLFLIIGFWMGQSPITADDHVEDHEQYNIEGHYKHYNRDHKENDVEDIGKFIGWTTVITMGGAMLLFPLRRNANRLMNVFSNNKNVVPSIVKFFTKSHILFGIIAIILSALHGILLFLHEGKWESEMLFGLLAFGLMSIASIFGARLFKNRKLPNTRSIHSRLVVVAVIAAVFHIIVS